jgi:hypothetical protein
MSTHTAPLQELAMRIRRGDEFAAKELLTRFPNHVCRVMESVLAETAPPARADDLSTLKSGKLEFEQLDRLAKLLVTVVRDRDE